VDLTKLGRTERVLAIVGLLAFIDSFLDWYSVTFKGFSLAGVSSSAYTASANAWNVGFWAWFPMLLLLAVGIVVALPAFGQRVSIRGGYAALGAATLLATIIVLIRWLTYPSASDLYGSAGAAYGTYIGLVLCVVATVFAYLGFTAEGGSLATLGQSFKARTQQQPQQQYQQAPAQYQQQPQQYEQPPQQ
jgi:glucan phosphoethanolaminetransferase (alkaline phosphatase superfamily)